MSTDLQTDAATSAIRAFFPDEPAMQLLRPTDAELAALRAARPTSPQQRLWCWLTGRVSFLKRDFKPAWGNDQPAFPVITNEDRAKLLAMLIDPDMRQAILSLLTDDIEAMAQDRHRQ